MPKRTTNLNSPCSPAWDDAWIQKVNQAEERYGHRICGAKTPAVPHMDAANIAAMSTNQRFAYHARRHAETLTNRNAPPAPHDQWVPCPLKPNHPNGRCRFHGGTDLSGGRQGNRNAVVHGLYARSLRPCATSCPLWTKCPMAGHDVAQLPPVQRPTCPYEQADYDAALTDTLAHARTLAAQTNRTPTPGHAAATPAPQTNPHITQLALKTSMLHVMMNRAATALREHDLIETTETTSGDYHAKFNRPHAYLQAFLRLSSEYRRYLDRLEHAATTAPYGDNPATPPTDPTIPTPNPHAPSSPQTGNDKPAPDTSAPETAPTNAPSSSSTEDNPGAATASPTQTALTHAPSSAQTAKHSNADTSAVYTAHAGTPPIADTNHNDTASSPAKFNHGASRGP